MPGALYYVVPMHDREARSRSIDWDAPLPEPYAAALREVLRRMFDPELWRLCTDIGDIGTIVGVGGRSESVRVEAAERIANRIGRPVHRERWQRVLEAIDSFAGELGHKETPYDELRAQAALKILEVAKAELGTWTLEEVREAPERAYKTLWSRLNKDLCHDLLGPEWRHAFKNYPASERPNEMARVEARITAEQLAARASLTARERAVLEADGAGYVTKETAQALGVATGTVYALRHRGMAKLRRAAGL